MGRVRNPIIWSAVATLIIGGSMLVHYRRVIAANVEVGRQAGTEVLISQLEQVLAMYRADHEAYPKSLDALTNPIGPGGSRYFGLKGNGAHRTRFVDIWGHPLMYREFAVDPLHPRSAYSLYSVGANGIDEGGGGDDVMTGD